MKEYDDPRERFRETLFNIVQYKTQHEVSPHAKSLVTHYFNSSTSSSVLSRGIEAVEKYVQDTLPGPADRTPRLAKMLDELAYWAERWDAE